MNSSKPAAPALDPRLSMVVLHVRENSTLADVGTDHGLLPVALVLSGKIRRAVCCDINEKPLQKAKILIYSYNLSDSIRCVLSDGLDQLSPDDADEIVMAGMGGELIAALIDRAPWLKAPGKRLILQPMSRPERLRRFLFGAGFSITREDGVLSQGKLYTVITAQYTGAPLPKTAADEYIGALPESPFPASADYLRKTARRIRTIARGLEQSNTSSTNSAYYYNLEQEVLSRIVEK